MRAVAFGAAFLGLVGGLTVLPDGLLQIPGSGWAQGSGPTRSDDDLLRKRAEDLARGATGRFDELVGAKQTEGRDDGRQVPGGLAEGLYAWFAGSARHYQDIVRRLAEPTAYNPVEEAVRRASRETRVADADLIEHGVGWIHRAGREYQELMRRLSVPDWQRSLAEARKAEEAQKAEAARRAAEAKRAEEDARRIAEAKRVEDERRADEDRRAAAAKQAEEEARRLAAKQAEEAARRAAEAKRAEEDARRMAEAKRVEDERRAEEERKAAAAKRLEDERRIAAAKKAEEDARRIVEASKTNGARRSDQAKRTAAKSSAEGRRRAPRPKVAAAGKAPDSAKRSASTTMRTAEARRRKQALRKAAAERRKYAWREPRVAGFCRSRARPAGDCRLAGARVAMPGWYIVKKGDTLWRIASRHYHKGRLYKYIYEANASRIDHPTRLYPCQRLYIPKVRWRRI